MIKSSDKAMEAIESLVAAIHDECRNNRQRCLRQLCINLREMKEVFELLRKEGK